MVSKKERLVYEKMADLFSEDKNRLKLREFMNVTKLPIIPYLGQCELYSYSSQCC